MKKSGLDNVKTLMAIDNPMVRQGLQNALQNEGFARAIEVASLDRLIGSLIETRFDLILASTTLGSDFVPPFMTQLRQGGLIHHPIPVIILFLTESNQDHVRRSIDCGPDDILQMPVSPLQLVGRIQLLAEKRKNFVVTSDYVGPDRRNAARPGTLVVPDIEVPNPILQKINRDSDDVIKSDIETAANRLRQMRLARFTYELLWLLRALRQMFDQGPQDEARLLGFCERFKLLIFTLPKLVPGGLPPALATLAERLDIGTNILMRTNFNTEFSVMQGLTGVIIGLTKGLRDLLPPELAETTLLNQPAAPTAAAS